MELKVAEIELTYRHGSDLTLLPVVKNADTAFELFRKVWNEGKMELIEEAKLMLLNNRGAVLGICNLSGGGSSGTIVDPKIVFAAAIKGNASSIILAHNHPSGGLQPSREDIFLTKKLQQAAEFLGIRLLDHLIITSTAYASILEHIFEEGGL